MIVKVCGLNDSQNIDQIERLQPNLLGFIFVDESPRNVQRDRSLAERISMLEGEGVGVFANESLEKIMELTSIYGLKSIQLHGDETPKEVELLKNNFKVIKAFSVDEEFEFKLDEYADADLFLFDTKGKNHGGNGEKFDWELLSKYSGSTPFLLSGGLQLEDVDSVLQIDHPMFHGIDVNSGFEDRPGIKNVEAINQLLKQVK